MYELDFFLLRRIGRGAECRSQVWSVGATKLRHACSSILIRSWHAVSGKGWFCESNIAHRKNLNLSAILIAFILFLSFVLRIIKSTAKQSLSAKSRSQNSEINAIRSRCLFVMQKVRLSRRKFNLSILHFFSFTITLCLDLDINFNPTLHQKFDSMRTATYRQAWVHWSLPIAACHSNSQLCWRWICACRASCYSYFEIILV